MLFGHSSGAQVAGDLASRVGTDQQAGIAAGRVTAVGLLGDPSRGTDTRTVPSGVAGQGILPARAAGFGTLDARTIEICAPHDPVCDSPPRRPAEGLTSASADPVHSSYPALEVASGVPAGRWAADSLARLVTAARRAASESSAPSRTTVPTSAVPTSADPTSADPSTSARTTPPSAPGRTPGTVTSTGSRATSDPSPTGPSTTTPQTSASTPPPSTSEPARSEPARSEPARSEPATTGPTLSDPSASDPTTSRPAPTGRSAGATWALSAGLEGFTSTPWNNEGATDPQAAPSPDVPGRTAVKFVMPAGGKRTEAEPDIAEFQAGKTASVGYAGYFAPGFPVDTDSWQLIMQFKQPGEGSPPLAVEVGGGQLRLANHGGNQKNFCAVTGGSFSFRLRITFGGTVDAWCGDRQTLRDYRTPASNVDGSAYLKTGIYRDQSITQAGTLFLDDLLIGDTVESVSGLAGGDGGGSGAGAGGDEAGASPAGASPSGASPSTNSASTPSAPEAPTTVAPAPADADPAQTAASGGGQKICEKFGSTPVADGRYLVQNNEWGADDGQCITATAAGFTVDSGDHTKTDSPAAYPSMMSGCWMGTCTTGTTLPRRISELGPISSSIAATIPAGTTTNLAYDLWADRTPTKTGQNDGLELMIWLDAPGGITPIGSAGAHVEIGGTGWEVWTGENGGVPVISYVREEPVTSAQDLPLTEFLRDAATRGVVDGSAYLTNIQAGFEPWAGGPGLRLDRFEVRDGGAAG